MRIRGRVPRGRSMAMRRDLNIAKVGGVKLKVFVEGDTIFVRATWTFCKSVTPGCLEARPESLGTIVSAPPNVKGPSPSALRTFQSTPMDASRNGLIYYF